MFLKEPRYLLELRRMLLAALLLRLLEIKRTNGSMNMMIRAVLRRKLRGWLLKAAHLPSSWPATPCP